jgi:hypothetical protein
MLAGVRRAAAELSASTTLTRALHMSPVAAAKAKTPKKGGAEEKEVRVAIPRPVRSVLESSVGLGAK